MLICTSFEDEEEAAGVSEVFEDMMRVVGRESF